MKNIIPSTQSRNALRASLIANRLSGKNRLNTAINWITTDEKSHDDLAFVIQQFQTPEKKSRLVFEWAQSRTHLDLEALELLLPLITHEQLKDTLLLTWLEKDTKTLAELEFCLPLITAGHRKNNILLEWIRKDERSMEDLRSILLLINNESLQVNIASQWLEKDGITFGNLYSVFPLIHDSLFKHNFAVRWLEKDGESLENSQLENLQAVFSLMDEDYSKKEIASKWFEKDGRSLEDLQSVLRLINEDFSTSEITSKWFEKDERSLEDLQSILRLINKDFSKSKIASKWFEKDVRSFEDLQSVLSLIKNDEGQNKIAIQWLRKSGKRIEDLQSILPLINHGPLRALIISQWLEKNDDLQSVLPLIDQQSQNHILSEWIGKDGRTIEDLRFVLSLINSDYYQNKIALAWLTKDDITLEDLQTSLPLITYENEKNNIALEWIEKDGRSFEDLQSVLALVNGEDAQNEVLLEWIEKDGRSFEDLQSVLALVNGEDHKSNIALGWINTNGNSFDHLEFCLPLIIQKYKSDAVSTCIKREGNLEVKYKNLLSLAKNASFCGLYDIATIITTYRNVQLPVNKMVDFCKDLYPLNENLQNECVLESLRKFDTRSLLEAKKELTIFITHLNNDEFALQTLSALKIRCHLLPLEMLEITQNRLGQKYHSLAEVLKNKKVKDSLNETGSHIIEEEFGSLPDEINLDGLFSYYERLEDQGLAIFKSFIKPEILAEIRASFFPSSATTYILPTEFAKIASLVNNNSNPEFNLTLPKIHILSDYLSKKMGDLTNFPSNKIDSYQFGESEMLEIFKIPSDNENGKDRMESQSLEPIETQSRLDILTEEFKDLLKENLPSHTKIAYFFEKSLSLDGKINASGQQSLGDFFHRDKYLLATLLQQKEGFNKFAANFGAISDGCFANIGTAVRTTLYASLIQDPCDQILFSVFSDKMNTAILNATGGVDHHAAGTNAKAIFTTDRVNDAYISPLALVQELKKEFYADGKIIRPPFEIEAMQDEDLIEHVYQTLNHDANACNNSFAELATQQVIQSTIPILLENKYLQEFNDKCNRLKSAAHEMSKSDEIQPASTPIPDTGKTLQQASSKHK